MIIQYPDKKERGYTLGWRRGGPSCEDVLTSLRNDAITIEVTLFALTGHNN
jgi:hypothetical protein